MSITCAFEFRTFVRGVNEQWEYVQSVSLYLGNMHYLER